MDSAEAGKQTKAKNGRRNHDKDTCMFAFTFLTITSFPATHGPSFTWYLILKFYQLLNLNDRSKVNHEPERNVE